LSTSARNRHERRSWGRSALGLFVAVWLNLALQPCAMAMEAEDDHHCPHCPTEEMQGHHGMHAGMDAEAPCADGLSDCSLDGDISHDTRSGSIKFKDGRADVPVAITATEFVAYAQAPPRERPPPLAIAQPGATRPLHVLYCVYLD